jgi:hypothetical protein
MAREGLLLHAGEDRINSTEPEPPKKRDFGNFWYYHKWHLLIALIVIVFAAFLLHDLFFKARPDYQVSVVSEQYLSDASAQQMEQELARYGTDQNGDGKVLVQLNQYVFPSDKSIQTQTSAAAWVKFESDLTAGTSVIFFTDEASFQTVQKQLKIFGNADGSVPKNGEELSSALRIPLSSCPAFSKLLADPQAAPDAGHLGDFGISLRVKTGVPAAYDAACRKMYEALMSGHPNQ